ncbi:unnamed protein product [Urochloa decumbens]|uniref:Uncharacterized protein n=1 Tax=Urochloa decumbens TaxID=240449 RepID=A0ABC9DRY6_9POAL
MGSHTALTILLGFWVVFWCLQAGHGEIQNQPQQQGDAAGVAAAAFLPALVTTFGLTLLLLFAHVRALGHANAAAGGEPGRRFVGRLEKAALASTMVAFLAGLVLRLAADGHLLGGADDIGWLHAK